jgi:hypothetical protein
MELESKLGVNGQFSLQPGAVDQTAPQVDYGYHLVRDSMWTSNRRGSSVIYASVITAWLFTSYAGFARSLAHAVPFLSSPVAYAICIILLFSSLTALIYLTRIKKFTDAVEMLDSNYAANMAHARDEHAKQIKKNNPSVGANQVPSPLVAAIARVRAAVNGSARAEKQGTRERSSSG